MHDLAHEFTSRKVSPWGGIKFFHGTYASTGIREFLKTLDLPVAKSNRGYNVLDLLEESTELRDKLMKNTKYFREKMTDRGFDIKPGEHPITPIMLYDAVLSQQFADKLLEKGIYVIGFYFPVVPKGEARIRVQISAAHEAEHLDKAIEAFTEVGKELKVIETI